MATSIAQFNLELYREHLEEASFLYDQRLAYLVDREVNWPDLHNWEERAEAHVDALAVGGDLAARLCLERAAEGDPGEIHTAIRVLCRQRRKNDVFSSLTALDPTNEAAIRAAIDGLCREVPARWQDEIAGELQSGPPHVKRILTRVVGYRRFPVEELLRTRLLAETAADRADLAWALGRIGSVGSLAALSRLMSDDDEGVREATAIALLRLGDHGPLAVAENAAPTQPWARRVLAIAGSSRVTPILLDSLAHGQEQNAVLALGLVGDLAAVVPLLELLDHEELAEAAAVALNTITGAELHGVSFVPDRIDRDELTDEERAAVDSGDIAPNPGGRTYGNNVRGPLLDKDGWRAWLDENKHRFNRRHRWRMGQIQGPAAVFACLQNATTPYEVRAAAYEELVIRFGLDIPFEVDLPVMHQMRSLQRIGAWAAERENVMQGDTEA